MKKQKHIASHPERSRRAKPATSSHKIQWLNLPGYKGESWNPIIGCSKVSEGCENCYAEKMAVRLAHIGSTSYYGAVTKQHSLAEPYEWNGKTHFVQSQIDKPLHWKKPRVIFVCSMGDLFHETVDYLDVGKVFDVIEKCQQHIFIILTKRAENMKFFFEAENEKPLPNVWLGVTAENQEQANKRIPQLIKIPAAVKFVSVEPMLSAVDLSVWLYSGYMEPPHDDIVNWVITGGESGHHARPMHPDWVRSIRKQCKAAEVPFFFKQWGELLPKCQYQSFTETVLTNPHQYPSPHNPDKTNTYYKVGKNRSGNLLDGEKCEEYPSLP